MRRAVEHARPTNFRERFTGLGSRIATRTFLTFAMCAALPIALVAVISDRMVSEELRTSAERRLTQATKSYGMLVFERLQQAEDASAQIAEGLLAGRLTTHDALSFESDRIQVLDAHLAADGAVDPELPRISILRDVSGGAHILLRTSLESSDSRATITSEVLPGPLWNTDPIGLTDARLCVVEADGAALYCSEESDALDADQPLNARWELFLEPSFGVDPWTIETQQSMRAALATLNAFKRTLPIVALISLAAALLLSVMQIRRSHRPLEILTDAAARLAQGRYGAPVVLDSRDEYGKLALAFNRMAASVKRQFALLAALARIDRQILASPSIESVLERTLPALPRLVGARAAAVFLPGEQGGAALYVAHRTEMRRIRELRVAASLDDLGQLLNARSIPELARLDRLCGDFFAAAGATALHAAPIRVDRHLRGVLLFGVSAEQHSPEQQRYLRSFARRFAVALGAQDRRQALMRQAYYDALTELPNRQLFKDRLQQELAHARRSAQSFAVIYIDLDRFKNVNDSLGHTAGDELLRVVSARLAAAVREVDTLARLGGDEFVVIASGLHESAHVVAERLQAALSNTDLVGGVQCFIEASMGIAMFPQDGDTAEALLRNADTAMYRAKAAGGGRVVYFEERMNREAIRRLDLEHRLRAALRAGKLSFAYQPKIDAADGAICGVEALARWCDAELGHISPAEFIPIAEECGLIDELGELAIREACRTLQSWRREGLEVGHVSVNVSLRQLRDQRLLECVQRTLDETQIPAHALELEVTESMLAEQPQQVMALLGELRALGVRIAIDDFGVGYSSVAALGQFPADVLKIDRSFIEHCATRRDAAALVEAIISMAHALGKIAVAEGVETAEQFQMLRECGCDVIQGFLFGRPMSAAEMARFSVRPEIQRALKLPGCATSALQDAANG